ncbi:MAG: hypothetical protein PV340_04610 [Wolbachia sp.]|nr:hypothetical protein [Wolbachia sp.]MDD9336489.1 hypothetical protein [Wolbachia sp.]
MKDKDSFEEENNNVEENNNDYREERSLKAENQLDKVEQYVEEEKQHIAEYIKDYIKTFEDLLNQIDEVVDKLDSYERTVQIKRSIVRLIETLYSQAALEDINTELETTKHTRDKSAYLKRIREKRRRQVIEEVLSNMFAQQQKEKDLVNAKRLCHGYETTKDTNVNKAKEQIKSSIKWVLFSVIGARMDPRRRAGETDDSNEKQAQIYNREAVGGALGALLKTFLTTVTTIVQEIVKPLRQTCKQETSFAKQVEESRNTGDKGVPCR